MMRFARKPLFVLTILGFAPRMTPVLHADDEQDEQPTSQPSAHVSLEHEMEEMGDEFRIIRRQVKDSTANASTINAVLDLEQHTLAAKSAVPKSATTMPTTAANGDKLADFHAMLINVLRQELDLEEQLRANKNDKAIETVDSLRELESEGHKEFRPRRNGR